MISLIVFLGNVGEKYCFNRHNVAWIFLQTLQITSTLSWTSKFKGEYANLEISTHGTAPEQRKIFLLKPYTFMNLSGQSVIDLASFYKILPEEILVIHDELELPPGTVSLKWSGGLGGHNGLRSIASCFGTNDFWRLRIGIGRPNHSDIAGYVLSDFLDDEKIILHQTFTSLEELLTAILVSKPETLLTEWKKKNLAAI